MGFCFCTFFADVAPHIDKNSDLPGRRPEIFEILHVEIEKLIEKMHIFLLC